MEKLSVLLVAIAFSMSIFHSCGSAEEKKDDSADTKAKAESELTLKLDDKKLHFDEVALSYDDMFGKQLDLSAFLDSGTEEAGMVSLTESFFNINIENLSLGEIQKTNISLKGYTVSDANAEVHELEIGSGMYGPKIDKIVFDFSATLHDLEGEEYRLNGKYTK